MANQLLFALRFIGRFGRLRSVGDFGWLDGGCHLDRHWPHRGNRSCLQRLIRQAELGVPVELDGLVQLGAFLYIECPTIGSTANPMKTLGTSLRG